MEKNVYILYFGARKDVDSFLAQQTDEYQKGDVNFHFIYLMNDDYYKTLKELEDVFDSRLFEALYFISDHTANKNAVRRSKTSLKKRFKGIYSFLNQGGKRSVLVDLRSGVTQILFQSDKRDRVAPYCNKSKLRCV